MTNFTFYIVDAFVDPDKSFSGNPAAVIILSNDNDINDEAKQNIAAQFNYSATVFVSQLRDEHENQFAIRWFTSVNELELCGHGTLAATYVLFNERHQYSGSIDKDKPVKYMTSTGETLEATFDSRQFVTLDFPLNRPIPIERTQCEWIRDLQEAILGSSKQIVDVQINPNQYLLVQINEDVDIEQVKPDFNRMVEIDNDNLVKLVIITQKADYSKCGAHYLSRIFSPWQGVNEDPACGSACTVSAPFWDKVYRVQRADEEYKVLHVKQASKRGALITNQLVNDRVLIGGQGKLFSKGVFRL